LQKQPPSFIQNLSRILKNKNDFIYEENVGYYIINHCNTSRLSIAHCNIHYVWLLVEVILGRYLYVSVACPPMSRQSAMARLLCAKIQTAFSHFIPSMQL